MYSTELWKLVLLVPFLLLSIIAFVCC